MKLFKSFILGLFLVSALLGAITFPVLNHSRIVDEAGLFSHAQKETLESTLSAHERATSNQIVVVTLASLQGYDIADFGYQLGRAWGIGTKERNNGVLLIIAPNERKVRIEVGYGLEGSLPDAIAHSIIQNTILPAFKAKNYFEGASKGVNAIISAIKGEYKADETTQKSAQHSFVVPLLFFFFMVFNAVLSFNASNRRRLFPSLFISAIAGIVSWFIFSMIVVSILVTCSVFLLSYVGGAFGGSTLPTSWGSGGGGSSSSGGFGGFSGGGGSFGGGGASGSW